MNVVNYPLKKFKEVNSSNLEFTSFLYQNYLGDYNERFDYIIILCNQKYHSNSDIKALLVYVETHKKSFLEYCKKLPSFIFWINGMEDILLESRNEVLSQNFTRQCLKEIGLEGESQDDFLTRQLGKYVVAHGVRYNLNNPLKFSLSIESNWIPGDLYFYASDKDLTISRSSEATETLGYHFSSERQEKVPIFSKSLPEKYYQVHNFDLFFNFISIERWERISDFEMLQRSAKKIKNTLELIEQILPGFNDQFELLIHHFIPITTDGFIDTQSGTYSGLFGAIFLTIPEQEHFIAEMLIHEFNHHKLFLLEEITPLFNEENYDRAHYSPLRDELRTQQGVYHALFVLSEILKFWSSAYPSIRDDKLKNIANRRVWTIVSQIKHGSRDLLLTSKKMSAVGKSILDSILDEVELVEKSFEKVSPRTLPYYTEIKDDKSILEMPIEESVLTHRKKMWNIAEEGILNPIKSNYDFSGES